MKVKLKFDYDITLRTVMNEINGMGEDYNFETKLKMYNKVMFSVMKYRRERATMRLLLANLIKAPFDQEETRKQYQAYILNKIRGN